MDYNREKVKAYMRWTKRRFKDNSPELVWIKILENAKMLKEFQTFENQPKPYSPCTVNIEFAIKTYGWQSLMDALWILASRKEELMHQMGIEEEETKWCKVKDKLAGMPRKVQM